MLIAKKPSVPADCFFAKAEMQVPPVIQVVRPWIHS